jgi:uncharacterized protein with HEPN domain
MSRDDATLLDLLEACRSALEFLGGMNRGQFVSDKKTRSAILHQLLVLGEATKRLTVEFRDKNPNIPWRELAGMRDRVIHAYDRVDLDMVWVALTKRLPVLHDFLVEQTGESKHDNTTPPRP